MAHRIRLLLVLAAVGAGSGFAQEKSAATDAPAIDEAKREFQVLKATRTAAEQAKIELPNVSLPNLPTGTVAPTAVSKNGKKEKSAQEKSKNWLLDAMEQTEKNATTTSERKRGSSKGDARDGVSDDLLAITDSDDLETPVRFLNELRDRAGKTSLKEKPEATLQEVAPKDNPLAPYMTGWISPRDHAVLLPQTSETPMLDASLSQLVSGPGTSPSGASPIAAMPAGAGLSGVFAPAAGVAGGATENPYLQLSLPSPPAAVPGLSLPSPGGLLSGPAVTELKAPLAEPPPPAKAPVAPVDLGKSPQDAKYFPQLKRF